MVRDLDVKVEIAYRDLKRNFTIYFSLLLLAFIATTSLVIYGIFYYNNVLGRVWSAVVILLLFVKLGYDAVNNMKERYREFKEEHELTDKMLMDL